MPGSPRLASIACLLLVTVALVPLAASQPVDDPADLSDCQPHPPIEIREDVGPRGFVLGHRSNGEPIHRPGSGVVAGNGTAEDPYVIEGWCIVGDRVSLGLTVQASRTSTGISIEGTSSHVVVEDNEVTGFRTGVHVQDVAENTVTVEANTIGDPLASVDATPVTEPVGDIAKAAGVGPVSLLGIGMPPNVPLSVGGGGDIQVQNAAGIAVVDNGVSSSIDVEASPGSLVEGNHLQQTLALETSNGSTLHDNAVNGTWDTGLYVADSNEVTIVGNDVDQQGYIAMSLNRVEEATVRGNELSAHPEAPWWPGAITLLVSGSEDVRFEENRFGNGAAGTQTSQNATFVDNRFEGAGLYVPDPVESNHTIEATNTVNGQPLQVVAGTDDVTVTEPAGQVIVDDAANVTLRNLDIIDAGVSAQDAPDLRIEGGTFTGAGIHLDDAPRSEVHNATIAGGSNGVSIRDSTDVIVEDNVVTGNEWRGISLRNANGALVQHNHASDNARGGIYSLWSGGTTIEANVVHGNGGHGDRWSVGGLDLGGGERVEANNVWGNEGLGLEGPPDRTVDASGNWWGCPEGPQHEDCDDVEGDVLLDPVLTEPHPDAGPR